jgi:polysaccharide deacetylase 2 family uncharacterized protein YibQ
VSRAAAKALLVRKGRSLRRYRMMVWGAWTLAALMLAGVGAGVSMRFFGVPKPLAVVQTDIPAAEPVLPALPQYEEPVEDDETELTPPIGIPQPRPSPGGDAATAARPPAALKGVQPAWLRYAVPPPAAGGRPMIAVVIDDLGLDRRRSDRVAALKGPLTLAYMTYAPDVLRQAAAARARGHELLVHVPMEPQAASYDPGPDVLTVGLAPDELRRRLQYGLSRFDAFVGINNHMGSRFTAHGPGMRVVMEELRERGLLFLDSVTSGKTVGPETARQTGVPYAARNVFLDNDPDAASVRRQLAKTEEMARKNGYAIAIGHPHDGTIEAIAGWLGAVEQKGFVLVPVSTIVRLHFGE